MGLQALLVEISTGLFEKNNATLINAGETQLMTSMSTMQGMLLEYGQDAAGYAIDIDYFVDACDSLDNVKNKVFNVINGGEYVVSNILRSTKE